MQAAVRVGKRSKIKMSMPRARARNTFKTLKKIKNINTADI